MMHPKQSDYPDQMMLAIYVTLGVFLLLAIRNPAANRSLIAFTGWSSLAHAAVMAVQSLQLGNERTELPPLGVSESSA
jgi:succinate-acetate transporter protein